MSEGTVEKKIFISLDDAKCLARTFMPSRHNDREDMAEFERGIQYASSVIYEALDDCRKIEVDPEQF